MIALIPLLATLPGRIKERSYFFKYKVQVLCLIARISPNQFVGRYLPARTAFMDLCPEVNHRLPNWTVANSRRNQSAIYINCKQSLTVFVYAHLGRLLSNPLGVC